MGTEGFDDALGAAYRLVERRGRGAMGEVWRAEHRRTGEIVAAKLLREEHVGDQDLVGRFLRERSILTELRDPGVVAVRDLVVEGGRLAIVMEYVDGQSLRDVLRSDGPLPPAVAVGLGAAVLQGLAAAHAKGVLHRDVKPDNVLLAEDWRTLQPGQVKLTDFGIARIVAEGAGTTTGLLGTPEYMSPELLTTGSCDLPADVYGVGILLYELLAGRTPFAGPGTDYTVAHRHATSEVPPLPVPEKLQELLSSLLEKDPRRRPAAAEAAAALRALAPGLVELPALPVQHAPVDFASAHGPATVVRGLRPDPAAGPGAGPAADPESLPASGGTASAGEESALADLDLGTPGQQTTVRPIQRPLPAPTERPGRAPVAVLARPWWREPRVLGVVAGALLLIAGAAVVVTAGGSEDEPDPASGGGAVQASQRADATPSGLSITRQAELDPHEDAVRLTITYASQKAPLRGPFLEVLPGRSQGSCPTVSWDGVEQSPDVASVSGITTSCAWAVRTPPVTPGESVSVSATVGLDLPGGDRSAALQQWLDSVGASTSAALMDEQITSTSYPVQRLQSVEVRAPERIVSQRPVPLQLLPVWPSGTDELNPIYRSPAVGSPTTMLSAIAGGEQGIRFADGCSGSLVVSGDGLVVTALSVAPECHVIGQVGNFTDLSSNTFAVVPRGG